MVTYFVYHKTKAPGGAMGVNAVASISSGFFVPFVLHAYMQAPQHKQGHIVSRQQRESEWSTRDPAFFSALMVPHV